MNYVPFLGMAAVVRNLSFGAGYWQVRVWIFQMVWPDTTVDGREKCWAGGRIVQLCMYKCLRECERASGVKRYDLILYWWGQCGLLRILPPWSAMIINSLHWSTRIFSRLITGSFTSVTTGLLTSKCKLYWYLLKYVSAFE